MNTVKELINFVISRGVATKLDKDIFNSIMPEGVSKGICVVPYGGIGATPFNHSTWKSIQIMCKAPKRSEAENLALDMYKILLDAESSFIKLESMDCPITLRDYPQFLYKDDKHHFVFVFNISILSMI